MGGYVPDWNHIQKTYPTMAPKDLGSMGYDGLSTTFLPKPAQQNAYSTAGLALEFYRNWNASWNTPSTYFATLSSIDTTKLMPCTDSVLSDDLVMRRHVKHTGDTDGVVITNAPWLMKSVAMSRDIQTCRVLKKRIFDIFQRFSYSEIFPEIRWLVDFRIPEIRWFFRDIQIFVFRRYDVSARFICNGHVQQTCQCN